MHPTLGQLLAYRDGEVDPVVANHLAGCRGCRQEVERLGAVGEELRRLPEIGPARDLWPVIEASLNRRRARERARALGIAAAVVLAVGGAAVLYRVSPQPSAQQGEVASSARETRVTIDELVSVSRELESLLDRPALRSRVMDPRQAAMVVELEDRIAGVDAVLTASTGMASDEQALALWLQRVRLLDALVQTRGAPSSTAVFQYAILDEGSAP